MKYAYKYFCLRHNEFWEKYKYSWTFIVGYGTIKMK